jgi:hypothetical protein
VVFQAKLKASSAKTIRMGILQLQTAGTVDTIPATLVTAFGADSTDPTLGANVAVITAAQSKSVTTSWQSFSVSVTVPTNSKNLICAIWSNADFAANDTLSIAEAGLFTASAVQAWTPRLIATEISLCWRYYWKTFGVDVAPAQNAGVLGVFKYIATRAGANLNISHFFRYPVSMFINPIITTYNPSAANAQVRDTSILADCSAVNVSAASNADGINIFCTGNASTAIGDVLDVHITAEAEL